MTEEAKSSAPVPLRVIVESSGKCVGYACGKCGTFHNSAIYACTGERAETAARESAERCCHKLCIYCGEVFAERSWTACSPCRNKKETERERARWNAAKKVHLADYGGDMVYRDGFGNEGYMYTTDIDDGDEDAPLEWAWGCTESKVTASDCDLEDHVRERILEDHHEDAYDLVDTEKVRAAEALLVEACSSVTSFQPDMSVVVLIPRDGEAKDG